jgi:hypothetical protein
VIVVKIGKNKKSEMIKMAALEIKKNLVSVVPPFNHEKDAIHLRKCSRESGGIKLTYEVLRNVRRSKAEENLSPYREKGLKEQIGRID